MQLVAASCHLVGGKVHLVARRCHLVGGNAGRSSFARVSPLSRRGRVRKGERLSSREKQGWAVLVANHKSSGLFGSLTVRTGTQCV
jgi:hypothetical protein